METTDPSIMSCHLKSQSNQDAAVNGGGIGLGETESAFGLTLNSNFAERNLLQEIASKSYSNAATTS